MFMKLFGNADDVGNINMDVMIDFDIFFGIEFGSFP